jgi:peptidylprolyl isomerase
MATKGKGARQQAVRRARIAAASEAARRHERRRRWTLLVSIGVGVVLIAAVALGAVVIRGDDKESNTASASNSSGDCVAMTDLPPAGAPYVPVHVGPPPTQLVTEELRAGTGPAVQPGDTVTVNYIGVSCSTGKIFDSSYGRGTTATFPLANVIPGWQQGIPGMQIGGQRLLGIPSDLAYGAAGRPGIAPNESLWFVVELVSIGDNPTTTAAAPSG